LLGSTRRVLAAGCIALAGLAVPAAASATVRVGQAIDAAGDSAGAPSQDIAAVAASYDDATGKLSVAAAMNGSVGSVPRSALKFAVASFVAPAQCGGASVTLSGFSDSSVNTVTFDDGGILPNGWVDRRSAAIAFNAQGAALRNRGYSCMTLTVSSTAGAVLDTLDVPLFFDGSGPDGDGDGVVDNLDNCSAVAGPAPTGCLPDSDGDSVVDGADQCPGLFGIPPTGCPAGGPLPGPPGIVTTAPERKTATAKQHCTPMSLKGKSLSAARRALDKAGCKLGKVTKPMKLKRGAKLVVTKQSGKNPVAITLGAAKKK
jgi:hypothetical protein